MSQLLCRRTDETGSLAIAGSFALAPQLVGGGVVPGSASVDSKLSLTAASNWSISSSSQAHNNWLMSSQNSSIPVSKYILVLLSSESSNLCCLATA